MALDLSKLLNKSVSAPSAEPAVESVKTPEVPVKTDSAPTKPKLAFQLGGKMVSAPVPEQAVNEPEPEQESDSVVPMDPAFSMTIKPAEPEVTEVVDFRAVMDELDSLFVEGTGYTSLTIDVARQRIVTAMKELKSNPELIQLVKDTDLRNIMAFINKSADSARTELGKKKETKEKKETTKTRRRNLDMSGFGATIAGVAVSKQTIPTDLESIAKMDLSQLKLPGK